MANELDVGSIVMRIRADASGVQEGLKQLEAAMGQAQAKTQQAGAGIDQTYQKMGQSAQSSAAMQAAAAATMAAAAAKAFATIVGAVDTGIKALNRYQAALIGVSSVAKGQGVSNQALTKGLNAVTDAFMDVGSASVAFKNLLARGYDIDQATNAILQLKDAAAFGRQGSLDLAEAVMSATEGLKNENSILVDNAGVTKNVSVMWKEYAASIGTTVDKLTTAQKIEAEVAGLRNETRFQTGDLAKLQDTLAGSQAKAAMSGELLARAYGSAMAPAVQAVTEIFGGFLSALTEVVNAAPELAAGLTGAGVAITGLLVAQKAVVAFKAMSTALQAMTANVTIFGVAVNTALPWLAAIGAVIGIATAVWTGYNKAQEEAAEAAKKAAEEEAERQKALQKTVTELTSLRDRYTELSQKTRRTYAESKEMKNIEQQLAEQYGITGSALTAQGEKYDALTGKINETLAAKLRDLQISKDAEVASAKATYEDAQAKAVAAREYLRLSEAVEKLNTQYAEEYGEASKKSVHAAYDYQRGIGAEILKQMADLEEAKKKLVESSGISPEDVNNYAAQAREAAGNLAKAYIDATTNAFEADGGRISTQVKAVLARLFIGLAETPTNIIHTNSDAMAGAYKDAIANMDISGAVESASEINSKIWSGMTPKDSDLKQMQDSFGVVEIFVRQLQQALNLSDEQTVSLAQSLLPVGSHLIESLDGMKEIPGKIIQEWTNKNLSAFIEAEGQHLAYAIADTRKAVADQDQVIQTLAQSMMNEGNIIAHLNRLIEGFKTGNAELVKSSTEALLGLGYNAPKTLSEAEQALNSRIVIQKDYGYKLGQEYNNLLEMQKTYQSQLAALEEEGRGASPEAAALRAFIEMINEAKRLSATAYNYDGSSIISDEDVSRFNAASASLAELSEEQNRLIRSGQESSDKIQGLAEKIMHLKTVQDGMNLGKTETDEYKAALDYLVKFDEFSRLALGNINDVNVALSAQEAILAGSLSTMTGKVAEMQALLDGLKERFATMDEGADKTALSGIIAELEQAIRTYQTLMEAPGNMLRLPVSVELTGGEAVLKQMEDLRKSAAKAQTGIEKIGVTRSQIADAKKMVAEAIRLEKAGKDAGSEWRESVNKAMGREFKGSAKEAAEALNNLDLSLQGEIDSMTDELISMRDQLSSLASGIVAGTIDVTVGGSVDASAILSLLDAAIADINARLEALGGDPLTRPSGGGRGGGGGGGGGNKDKGNAGFKAALDALEYQVSMGRKSLTAELNALLALKKKYQSALNKDERMDLEKRIYDAQEAIRKANLQKDLDALEHKKSMGRLSLQAEIAALQKILKAHKLNAEERRSVLEQLHAAEEALRQERLNKELRLISHGTTMQEMTTEQEIKALEKILATHKLTADERMDIEEQLHAAQERLRSEKLSWDLALLDHQVAMGKASTAQEIARLIEIKNTHELTQEEIMQIDERIYRLQNQLRQESVSKTKTAYDQIVQALKNRLNEQKRLEDKALDERIDALNELTKAENEAKKKDDYAQNLADKQRELSVEKSARRRRELAAEIAKMEADEALRLTQAARQEEIDALKEQKNAVNEKYAQLTSEENLRQEALRLVMSNNLQEMTDLIASYGNQWQDAGAQLAQALSDGLIGGGSMILDTIQKLNDSIQENINNQLIAIGGSIPNTAGTGGVVINLYGATVREETDIDDIADKLFSKIQSAKRKGDRVV